MPRHDHVRVPRQAYAVRREAAPVKVVELGDELFGIDHAARADRALLARDDARRQVAELEDVLADLDRVTGVRAALVAADEI